LHFFCYLQSIETTVGGRQFVAVASDDDLPLSALRGRRRVPDAQKPFVTTSSGTRTSDATSHYEQSLTSTGQGSDEEGGECTSPSGSSSPSSSSEPALPPDVSAANRSPRYGSVENLVAQMSKACTAVKYMPYHVVPNPPVAPCPGGHVAHWFARRGWCIGEIAFVREGESQDHKRGNRNKPCKSPPKYHVLVKMVDGTLVWMQFYEDGSCDMERYVVLDAPDVPSSLDLCKKPAAGPKKKKDDGADGPGSFTVAPAAKRCRATKSGR
jgi:hypothetical protein